MSIVTQSKHHVLPVSYCPSEAESDSSSDSQSFEEFDDRENSRNNSRRRNSSIFESTQEIEETDISTNELVSNRKRRRERSSSEESQRSTRSCSVSPEITYGGSPVKYKLCRIDGTLLVIKKSMSSTPSKRSQKCTDQDISNLLDSDSDLEIFDPARKIGCKIVGPLPTDSPNKSYTPSKSELLKKEEVSLRIKLRRSTEQSNYKIEPNIDHDKTQNRTSRRSTKGTPKKCGMIDCDEDHSVHGIRRASTLKTPNISNVTKTPGTSSARRTSRNSKSEPPETKSPHNKENESEPENETIEENDESVSRTKKSTKSEFGTPSKTSKRISEVDTPKSARLRRNSRLVNYYHDALENSKASEEKKETPKKKVSPAVPRSVRARRKTRLLARDYDDHERPNYEDEDSNSEAEINVHRGKKQSAVKNLPETPEKKMMPSTPRSARARKSTRSESYVYEGNEESNDEDNDRKDSSKMVRKKSEAKLIGTPRRQIKKLEEPLTPSSRPKRNTRLVNYNYDGLNSPEIEENGKNKIDKDEVSRRPGTRRKTSKEGSATPQKQLKISEEPSTSKSTPRKSAVKKLGEASPMRTPRKSTLQQIDEEPPRTPTTAAKRISKSTTPSVKTGSLTPSMTRRTANVGKPKTILEEARAQLHVSAVPKSLPCREEEFNDIFTFLETKLSDKSSGCIYISGVPGTGKTATVNEAIRCLKKLVSKGELENFDFIEINGMKLSEPRQAYVQILKQVNGQTSTWEQAYRILEKRFTKSSAKRPITLLLVDELDLLCNKRQDVVYNLLDWPAKENAQLVVITIANTMDLPERVLMGRVTSRLGLTRLIFQPYNHRQLQEIVIARLKDSDAFKSEAIQLVARKVAAVSGDARRALDICRRATEITELADKKIVTMAEVNQALTEMIASAKVQAVKHCSEMEKIFLQAVCAEVTRTGVEEAIFQNVYRQLESLCSFEGLKVPNITQALNICARLGGNRLLLCEHSRNDIQQRIILNVSVDDIHFAMKNIKIKLK